VSVELKLQPCFSAVFQNTYSANLAEVLYLDHNLVDVWFIVSKSSQTAFINERC